MPNLVSVKGEQAIWNDLGIEEYFKNMVQNFSDSLWEPCLTDQSDYQIYRNWTMRVLNASPIRHFATTSFPLRAKKPRIYKRELYTILKSLSALDPSRIVLWNLYMMQWFLSRHVLIP